MILPTWRIVVCAAPSLGDSWIPEHCGCVYYCMFEVYALASGIVMADSLTAQSRGYAKDSLVSQPDIALFY